MSDAQFNPGNIALQWWRELHGDPAASEHWKQKGDAGALARLRRASSPVEALAEARTIELAKRLGAKLDRPHQLARIGTLAAVLAHVKSHDGKLKMAQMLGPDNKGESAAMSALRFQRLMAAETPEDLMRQMRNAVKLLKGTANVIDIAAAIYWWNDNTRIRWTYDYWGAGMAAPTQPANIFRRPHHEPLHPASPFNYLSAFQS